MSKPPTPRRGVSPLAVLAGLVLAFAVGQAAWCSWEWSRHAARWVPIPAVAAWGVGAVQLGMLALACRRAAPAWAGAASTLAAAELLLVDSHGRAWLGLTLPAALWVGFLIAALELVRWWAWTRGAAPAQPGDSLANLWRAYAVRAPLLLAAGLAIGLAAALAPSWVAPWLGVRWANGIEAGAAFTAGTWVLLLNLVACSLWLATRPARPDAAPPGPDP